MKTVVFQAYGDTVPSWITSCITSVRDWTSKLDYHYESIARSDLLADAPPWLHERCGDALIHPLLDYSRVRRACSFLGSGWERAVWFDADVVILQPDRLRLPVTRAAAVVSETWTLWHEDELAVKQRLTNCVCQFVAGDAFTARYLDMMDAVGRKNGALTKAVLGTDLLTDLPVSERSGIIRNVGNLSPHALAAIAGRDRRRVETLLRETGESLYAVNVCASHVGNEYAGVLNDTEVYEEAIQLLREQPQLLEATFMSC